MKRISLTHPQSPCGRPPCGNVADAWWETVSWGDNHQQIRPMYGIIPKNHEGTFLKKECLGLWKFTVFFVSKKFSMGCWVYPIGSGVLRFYDDSQVRWVIREWKSDPRMLDIQRLALKKPCRGFVTWYRRELVTVSTASKTIDETAEKVGVFFSIIFCFLSRNLAGQFPFWV